MPPGTLAHAISSVPSSVSTSLVIAPVSESMSTSALKIFMKSISASWLTSVVRIRLTVTAEMLETSVLVRSTQTLRTVMSMLLMFVNSAAVAPSIAAPSALCA